MTLILALTSIVVIAILAWGVRRISGIAICPICGGVAGTWLLILVLRALAIETDPAIVAMLIGGSAVGMAYQVAKRIPEDRAPGLWLAIAVPLGFAAAYGVAYAEWPLAAAGVVGYGITAWVFRSVNTQGQSKKSPAVERLKKEMEQCC